MMLTEQVIALILFASGASASPGPNNLMLMASGANYGFSKTVPHMLGVCLGFVFMVIMVGLGLIGLFETLPILQTSLKIISIIYLIYLAWKIATTRIVAPAPKTSNISQVDDGLGASNSKPFTFLQAALFQWVNPKAWAMALTSIGVFTPDNRGLCAIILVAVVFGSVNLPIVSGWVVLGTQLRRLLNDRQKMRMFNLTAALLLMISLYPILISLH